MERFGIVKVLVVLGLVVIMAAIPLIGTGCVRNASGIIATTLSATMIPDLDLDAYLYFDQGSPIAIPHNLINMPADIKVDSLALWGLVSGGTYSIGGALTFVSAADASSIYPLIPAQTDVWKKLADRTIYVVRGSGAPAESFKSAISDNRFRHYDNSLALDGASRLPVSDTSRPVAIAIIKLSQPLIDLLKNYVGTDRASTIDTIYTWAKAQMIIAGLYLPQPVDLADIAQRIYANTIRDANIGVVVSIDSSLPGVIVGPLDTKFLDDNKYSKVQTDNLTIYETYIDSRFGNRIPVFISVDGNRVFATSSGRESYAWTLMTTIKR